MIVRRILSPATRELSLDSEVWPKVLGYLAKDSKHVAIRSILTNGLNDNDLKTVGRFLNHIKPLLPNKGVNHPDYCGTCVHAWHHSGFSDTDWVGFHLLMIHAIRWNRLDYEFADKIAVPSIESKKLWSASDVMQVMSAYGGVSESSPVRVKLASMMGSCANRG